MFLFLLLFLLLSPLLPSSLIPPVPSSHSSRFPPSPLPFSLLFLLLLAIHPPLLLLHPSSSSYLLPSPSPSSSFFLIFLFLSHTLYLNIRQFCIGYLLTNCITFSNRNYLTSPYLNIPVRRYRPISIVVFPTKPADLHMSSSLFDFLTSSMWTTCKTNCSVTNTLLCLPSPHPGIRTGCIHNFTTFCRVANPTI